MLSAVVPLLVSVPGAMAAPIGAVDAVDNPADDAARSPSVRGSTASYLLAVSARSPDDVWAAGATAKGTTDPHHAYLSHWAGRRWRSVHPGAAGGRATQDTLLGIETVSASDVWAVGARKNDNERLGLVQHWDGASWSVVPSPSPHSRYRSVTLADVSAVTARDVWAVGSYYAGARRSDDTLIEHWDGRRWSIVDGPVLSGIDRLTGVDALAADDVWAVGSFTHGDGQRGTLVEHWDGQQWTRVSSPDPGDAGSAGLSDVAAVSATDVWAVGDFIDAAEGESLIEHWDGATWTVVPSPHRPDVFDALTGVSATSAGEAWAVGNAQDVGPLTLHWDGADWTDVGLPGSPKQSLFDVAVVAASDVWAVGRDFGGPEPHQPLIEHWDGRHWQRY
jgi:hypothetical protein